MTVYRLPLPVFRDDGPHLETRQQFRGLALADGTRGLRQCVELACDEGGQSTLLLGLKMPGQPQQQEFSTARTAWSVSHDLGPGPKEFRGRLVMKSGK
jgi:hypothetical protein